MKRLETPRPLDVLPALYSIPSLCRSSFHRFYRPQNVERDAGVALGFLLAQLSTFSFFFLSHHSPPLTSTPAMYSWVILLALICEDLIHAPERPNADPSQPPLLSPLSTLRRSALSSAEGL